MKKSELKKLIKESLLGEQISIGDFSKEQSQNSDLYLQKVKMTSKKIINRDNPREKLTYGDFAPEGVEKFFGRSANELEGFNRHKWIEDVKQLTLQDFEYELSNYDLNIEDPLCVSNKGKGIISFTEGSLLVIHQKE